MVVGLLVILGTLGGTFLLVSSLDARQSRQLAGRGRAELLASGAVGQIVRKLGEDLYYDGDNASAPYTATNVSGTNAYKYYIDYPSESVDRHLYGTDDKGHLSNVLGISGTTVATESDSGTPDAYLIGTGEFSEDGKEYYIAMKVVDLASLACLNTGGRDYINVAGAGDTSRLRQTPILVQLNQLLGGNYTKIHNARRGAGSADEKIYDIECGRFLMNPNDGRGYMPFAIADEVYLRWLGSGQKAKFGRVYEQLGSANADMKRLLTTMNSSRSITRNPITKVVTPRFDLSEVDILDEDAKREGLYTELVMIAGSDDGQGGGIQSGQPVIIDSSSRSGVRKTSKDWKNTSGVSGAYGGNVMRFQGDDEYLWWVFENMPASTYKVWASWGHSDDKPAGTSVEYRIYTDGTFSGSPNRSKFRNGNLQGTFVVDQTVMPEKNIGGQLWQSLGSYSASGQVSVQIQGPQFVPEGELQFSFADAIRIEGVGLNLGSGSQEAAHLTANLWASMAEDSVINRARCFPFRPAGKNYTVFGVKDQPFITEAFVTHTTRSVSLGTEDGDQPIVDEDSWNWGVAIELMNFTDRPINLTNYRIVAHSSLGKDAKLLPLPANTTIPAGTAARGGRLVLYDFGAGKPTVKPDNIFGVPTAQWKRVTGLNFDNKTIRLVQQVAKKLPTKDGPDNGQGEKYLVPIDHAKLLDSSKDPDELYTATTESVKTIAHPDPQAGKAVNETTFSNWLRDDSVTRRRFAVAISWKPDKPTVKVNVANAGAVPKSPVDAGSHKLAQSNNIGLTGPKSIPEATLIEGFRMKMKHGLLSGPGDITRLYVAGPVIYHDDDTSAVSTTTAPYDLPALLARDFATEKSKGRANSWAPNKTPTNFNSAPWNKFPRNRGGVKLSWPILLGEVVETVPMDVRRGDSPTRVYGRVNVNTASKKVLELLPWPTGINASAAASHIIAYRIKNAGFITPGEVALAFPEGLTPPAKPELDRDAIYAAISSCVTVNSDMYAVNIKVQLGRKTVETENAWHYVAVIDRGCAKAENHKPAVLLFTQVK